MSGIALPHVIGVELLVPLKEAGSTFNVLPGCFSLSELAGESALDYGCTVYVLTAQKLQNGPNTAAWEFLSQAYRFVYDFCWHCFEMPLFFLGLRFPSNSASRPPLR